MTKEVDATGNTDKSDEGLHYLWHLQAIGLIPKTEDEGGDAAVFEAPASGDFQKIRVAIIDNGCAGYRNGDDAFNAFEHPNLKGTRLVDPIDFSAYVEGLRFMGQGEDEWTPVGKGLDRLSENKDELKAFFEEAKKGVRRGLGSLVDTILSPNADTGEDQTLKTMCYPELPDPSDRFAAHGTCCAGLVAANPLEKDGQKPPNPNSIRYMGVNPTAHIIPISTVYNQEYWPLICGLLWAVVKGADVILIPRGMEEMDASENKEALKETDLEEEGDLRTTRFMSDPTRFAEKQMFETLLKRVSDVIPVVMAAGNDGGKNLSYPASLKTHSNSSDIRASNLFVAGAVTARGEYSSYSSGVGENDDVVLYAPSDDAEEYSGTEIRFDDTSWRARNLPALKALKNENCYSPYGVLAIDIPGQYGYVADPGSTKDFDELHADLEPVLTKMSYDEQLSENPNKIEYKKENLPRALYTTFGGTSAAASILAGIISWYLQLAGSGEEEKSPRNLQIALQNARIHAPNLEHGGTNNMVQIVSARELLTNLAQTLADKEDDKDTDPPSA